MRRMYTFPRFQVFSKAARGYRFALNCLQRKSRGFTKRRWRPLCSFTAEVILVLLGHQVCCELNCFTNELKELHDGPI